MTNWNGFRFALAAMCSALAGQTASGAPLRRADVSADPAWVLHVDCDALRPTAVGQFILSEMDKAGPESKLAAFEAIFGIDPRKQLHGITVYSGATGEQGVLLVYADFDPSRLVALAEAAHDYEATQHNRHTIHSWIDEKKKPRGGIQPRTYAAIHHQCVLFGQQEEVVAGALDVMDGATPNLASGKAFPMLGSSGSGKVIQAAGRKMDIPGSDPKATLFKLSKQAWLEASDTGHQVAATLTLEADDEDTANSMISIAQGLVALVKLQQQKGEKHPERAETANVLLRSLTLKQEGSTVVAGLSIPENEAIDLYKAAQARKAEKKAAHADEN